MSRKKIYIYVSLGIIVFLGWMFSKPNTTSVDFSERVKVSLRDVGNQLLLSNQDSTSLVLPIEELGRFRYKLSFQNPLSFEPSIIINTVKNSFKKADLYNYYRVEVKQCVDNEVAYSYEIKNSAEKDIIPCKGRVLPIDCYVVELKFTHTASFIFSKQFFLFALLFLLMVFVLDYIFSKPKVVENEVKKTDGVSKLGVFTFYPNQNKLVKQSEEISLSKKECELLEVFVSKPNQIITREELTKKVWEDNGVFVGRSLDTYVSKLRKKLKEDTSIRLTNVHGVGYKLEID
ncbi:transcriptional regulator [Tenacibaculum holothuriorum]|uniref:Transcriptional regulator n=2 Tax=Tenacibaculum holothuriorum TaxID=1635173 RepID=A0A1Y2PEL0_9FLAO|nr:transcriptional regulator [Tenacibaculum holothuriorum]